MSDNSGTVRLIPDVHSFVRGRRLFLLNGESLGWAALPLNLAPALELCDGRTVTEFESQWNFSQVSALDFLKNLDGANLLERSDTARPVNISRNPLPDQGKPQVFIMKLTEKCNMRCTYCYDEAGLEGTRMTLDTFKAAVDFAFNLPSNRPLHFHFHGGEPLTNWPVFVEGAKYIRTKQQGEKREVSLSMATNGVLLNEEKLRLLADYKFGIRLSFDGLPELHDLYRKGVQGTATADRLLETLELVNAHPGIQAWSVLSTITAQASSQLPEIARFLQSRGVPSAEFMPCRLQGHAQGKEDLRVDTSQFVNGLKKIVELIEQGIISSLRIEALIRLLAPLLTNDFIHAGCGEARCGAGKDLMVIDPTGDLRPCDVIPKTAFLPLGHISTGLIRDFSMELEHASVYKAPDCMSCPWLKPCRGGCPGSAMTDDGDFYSKHSFACEMHLEMYPFLLEKLCDAPALRKYFDQHYYRSEHRWMLNAD